MVSVNNLVKMNIEIENHSWQYLPKIVYSLHSQESNEQGTNLAIILLLPVWIESIVYTVLNEHLYFSKTKFKGERESMAKRVMQDILNYLEKASWGDYSHLSELIFGKKLDKFVDNNTWRAVKMLYEFRNKVAHGKPFLGRYSSGNIELDGVVVGNQQCTEIGNWEYTEIGNKNTQLVQR